ncbi:LysM peptidoglycan-binding domain-containing protein [Spirillospora sp. NPDC048911]|uniref:LysM peptidoglycan-binding domain-containing protein n=1 Tax=Spirillospora sp. NPDC048911 TaxID=3364527 RepID=UPI003720D70E
MLSKINGWGVVMVAYARTGGPGPRPGDSELRPGVRLTRRGRVVLTTFAASTLLVAFWLTAGHGARAGDDEAAPASARLRTVVVEPGDTLWDIASRHTPESDPRRTVDRIIDLNGLPGPVVQPGQHLRLPTR